MAEEERKNQKIYCTDSEKRKLVEYRDAMRRGEVWALVGTKTDEIIGPKIGPLIGNTDLDTKLNEILERVNYQPLDRSYRTMLEQAIFLWQYETNKRADLQNTGTPQGLELYKFVDWCKTNRPDLCPDDNNIANFVDRLRIKT